MPFDCSAHSLPPEHCQVLIIGGGPAGAYAASVLAREGLEVTVFEAAKFPRYHVGESLIPSVRHYLQFIGAEDRFLNYGFVRKPGAAMKFNQYKREGYTDFVALGHNNSAWNVVRSDFDHLLLSHARSSGASVYEQTRVTSIDFSLDDPLRPISVSWTHTPPPTPLSPPASPILTWRSFPSAESASITGQTKFSYLIDATGRAGIMSTRYLKNRHFNMSLKNIAVWGYWRGTGAYGVGTPREGAPYFEALTDESGWAWFIPLHDGTASIGVVMNEQIYRKKCKSLPPESSFSPHATPNFNNSTMTAHYISNLALAPGVVRLISEAGVMEIGSVKSASDYSYSAPIYAGPNYRIIGDAGAFIDPFFSSGVHLAMTSALSASASICASIRGDCSEESAIEWHNKRVATSYTRFQIVVLSAYKQIHAQNANVLSDINEDNYDRAFSLLRPVIQGASEVGARLSETELQKSLDFCINLFNPTNPEEHQHLFEQTPLGRELFDVRGPLRDPLLLDATIQNGNGQPIASAVYLAHGHNGNFNLNASGNGDGNDGGEEDDTTREAKMILRKINARRLIHAEYALHNMQAESLDGYVVRLEVGNLGLTAKMSRRPSAAGS
ncbi:hypothetical protein AX16_004029 [Volvariella volvacea WC 439]|nr:hypothetical protein AX16_004029 [Volvariella volvacea WC 439]